MVLSRVWCAWMFVYEQCCPWDVSGLDYSIQMKANQPQWPVPARGKTCVDVCVWAVRKSLWLHMDFLSFSSHNLSPTQTQLTSSHTQGKKGMHPFPVKQHFTNTINGQALKRLTCLDLNCISLLTGQTRLILSQLMEWLKQFTFSSLHPQVWVCYFLPFCSCLGSVAFLASVSRS